MSARSFQCVLTARDRDLLSALTLRVKLLSVEQVRRTWWSDSATNRELRRRVSLLASIGLVERLTVVAGPVVTPNSALAAWRQGGPVPDFEAVAATARVRWAGALRAHQVLVASPAAADLVGGRARRSRPSEVVHDLHLAEVYLLLRRERPADARLWTGEAALSTGARSGEKVPDAVLRRAGRPVAMEVCGASYTPAKLRAFHDYCAARRLGYEIW